MTDGHAVQGCRRPGRRPRRNDSPHNLDNLDNLKQLDGVGRPTRRLISNRTGQRFRSCCIFACGHDPIGNANQVATDTVASGRVGAGAIIEDQASPYGIARIPMSTALRRTGVTSGFL